MSARDYDLPEELEALLQRVCAEQGVPAREHDQIRTLVGSPPSTWPTCCRGSCSPCVDEHTAVARAILASYAQR